MFFIQLLDLGAGDGQITAVMERLYGTVSVTEASKVFIGLRYFKNWEIFFGIF